MTSNNSLKKFRENNYALYNGKAIFITSLEGEHAKILKAHPPHGSYQEVEINELKPLPLDGEVLKAINGWLKITNDNLGKTETVYFGEYCPYHLVYESTESFKMVSDLRTYDVKYVHEVQNIHYQSSNFIVLGLNSMFLPNYYL